jgi:hypothetical protein
MWDTNYREGFPREAIECGFKTFSVCARIKKEAGLES